MRQARPDACSRRASEKLQPIMPVHSPLWSARQAGADADKVAPGER